MKAFHRALVAAASSALMLSATFAVPVASAQAGGLPVFDVTNYSQNLLQAARALEQINNQVRSLQNEASMLQNMGKNLQRIDFPQLQRINSAMQRIDQLMAQAQGN
ncbi:MAG TPA: P-type conjugative transfer protein TrbJ, partial [Sphingomicrobium sp.]|nr:P-type conjugative transfer protein TrbJ [Sphingomicrobium sp.]